MKVGDYVCIHGRNMGHFHVPWRIVREFAGWYEIYCLKGVVDTLFTSTELIPLTDCSPIPLDEWRQAPKVSLRSVTNYPPLHEPCSCHVTEFLDSITLSSTSEGENEAPEM